MKNYLRWTWCALACLAMAVASAWGGNSAPATRPDPEQIFRRVDANHDGKLNRKEFLQFAAKLPKLKDDPKRAEALFHRLDANQDGFLSLEEFKKLFTLSQGQGQSKHSGKSKSTVKQ